MSEYTFEKNQCEHVVWELVDGWAGWVVGLECEWFECRLVRGVQNTRTLNKGLAFSEVRAIGGCSARGPGGTVELLIKYVAQVVLASDSRVVDTWM